MATNDCTTNSSKRIVRPQHISPREWILEHRSHDAPGPLETPCRIWEGAATPQGYGLIGVPGGIEYVHRVVMAFELEPRPPMHVLHKCHNPSCVNPSHLYLGTHRDNMGDKVRAGRQPRGEAAGMAKIKSPESILRIRHLYFTGQFKQQALADMFGISQAQVSRIVRGETWAHLPIPAFEQPNLFAA